MLKKILGIIILAILVGGTFFMFAREIGSKSVSVDHTELNLQTKTSEGAVTIDLTPKEFDGKNFYVDIGVNTHTVDLSQFDLKKLVTLEINDVSMSPISAPSLSGHHNSGTLIFGLKEEPRDFTIEVREFPDMPVRIFEW